MSIMDTQPKFFKFIVFIVSKLFQAELWLSLILWLSLLPFVNFCLLGGGLMLAHEGTGIQM